jgi:hypothetical protein
VLRYRSPQGEWVRYSSSPVTSMGNGCGILLSSPATLAGERCCLRSGPPSERWASGGSGRALLSTESSYPCRVALFYSRPLRPARGSAPRRGAPTDRKPAVGRRWVTHRRPTSTPSPNRSALLAFPPPLPMERTCKHKAQHSGPPAAESLPERRKHEPWPPPSRRHPLGLLPRPYTAASLLTSHLHAHAPSRVTVNPQHGILWQAWGEISFRY